jgi:predicted metalloprotease with PDZ domain
MDGGCSASIEFTSSGKASIPFLKVNGAFAATTKSFLIDHPTKAGMQLRYGSLEGPENGVYVRGRLTDNNVIELPDYWTGLVHADSITVNLTACAADQQLYVERVENNCVHIVNETGKPVNCFYTVYGERKDVDKLVVECE